MYFKNLYYVTTFIYIAGFILLFGASFLNGYIGYFLAIPLGLVILADVLLFLNCLADVSKEQYRALTLSIMCVLITVGVSFFFLEPLFLILLLIHPIAIAGLLLQKDIVEKGEKLIDTSDPENI